MIENKNKSKNNNKNNIFFSFIIMLFFCLIVIISIIFLLSYKSDTKKKSSVTNNEQNKKTNYLNPSSTSSCTPPNEQNNSPLIPHTNIPPSASPSPRRSTFKKKNYTSPTVNITVNSQSTYSPLHSGLRSNFGVHTPWGCGSGIFDITPFMTFPPSLPNCYPVYNRRVRINPVRSYHYYDREEPIIEETED